MDRGPSLPLIYPLTTPIRPFQTIDHIKIYPCITLLYYPTSKSTVYKPPYAYFKVFYKKSTQI